MKQRNRVIALEWMLGFMLAGWMLTMAGDPVSPLLNFIYQKDRLPLKAELTVENDSVRPIPIHRFLREYTSVSSLESSLGSNEVKLLKLPVRGVLRLDMDLVCFTFYYRGGFAVLNYESNGIEQPDQIEILLNGHTLGYASAYFSGIWSSVQKIPLPTRYLHKTRENWIGFRNRNPNLKNWALRRIEVTDQSSLGYEPSLEHHDIPGRFFYLSTSPSGYTRPSIFHLDRQIHQIDSFKQYPLQSFKKQPNFLANQKFNVSTR